MKPIVGRIYQYAAAVYVLVFILTACSGGEKHKRNADFLPPMHINISDDVKGDTELVEVVTSSEKAINEFSDNIEQLAIDGKEILQKSEKGEELSLMDNIKAGKMMLAFASHSTQMVNAMEKFTDYVETKKAQNTLSDAQLKALEQVGNSFKERIAQINKKYEHYFDKK